MSDEAIKEILIERKRKARKKEQIKSFIEGFIGFSSLIVIVFMLTVIGG